jgi:hypothetical protein
MQIKDLSLELDTEALAAVHGGSVTGTNLGAIAIGPVSQAGGSGFSAFSPVSNTNVQAPTLTQTNVGLDNDVFQRVLTINDNDTANLIGSAVGTFGM